jgi:hypothetical protein
MVEVDLERAAAGGDYAGGVGATVFGGRKEQRAKFLN